jgi:segregation and condensation protein A
MPYEVRTPVYEGPFDLLLHLILRSEVELFEVSLRTIVDEYLAEIERMETLDLDVATEFLLIAATLVELKARRLLPDLGDAELDEELLRFEARDLLLARLLECKTFKDAADAVAGLITRADRSVPRIAGPEEPFRSLVPDPLDRVTLGQLAAAARRALSPKPKPVVDTDHVAPVRASVADAIAVVLDRLPTGVSVSFSTLAAGAAERVEAVVRFLAVLELYKQGVVELDQAETFGTLTVTRLEDAVSLDALSVADWDLDVTERPVIDDAGDEPDEIDADLDAAIEALGALDADDVDDHDDHDLRDHDDADDGALIDHAEETV